jgi:hypothetical protein
MMVGRDTQGVRFKQLGFITTNQLTRVLRELEATWH